MNAHNAATRHAIRLAVAVPMALIIADAFSLPRGYWVAFSVAVVLKPDYSSLFRRGLARGVGTVVGATVAALIIGGLQPDRSVLVLLVGLCAWAGYSLWQASFAIAIGFITALVLVLLSTTQANPLSTATDRLLDTVVGGAIALGIYVLWPTWSAGDAYDALSQLVQAERDYLDAVLGSVQGLADARLTLPARARRARLAWSNAEAAIGRSMDEPAAHRLDTDFANGVLAVVRRLIESTHLLRVEAERGIVVNQLAALSTLGRAFHDSLTFIADELVTARSHDPFALRAAFDEAVMALDADHAPESIALELDLLVDAVNTLNALGKHREPTA